MVMTTYDRLVQAAILLLMLYVACKVGGAL